jgi:DNA-binding GntR family transcriptional regulator
MFDMRKLDPDDSRPQYVQVADAFREAIRDGELAPGNKLPSHGEVTTEFDVSIGTVKRAYAQLQADGLIVSRQGQGSYIRTGRLEPDTSTSLTLESVAATLTDFGRRLEALERWIGKQ